MQANHSAQLPRAGTQPAAVQIIQPTLTATPRCKRAAMTAGEDSEIPLTRAVLLTAKGLVLRPRSLI